MSVHFPHHPEDHDSMVHEHNQFTDSVGDAVMRIQDEAYELGRIRGKMDSGSPTLLAALNKAVSVIERGEKNVPVDEWNAVLNECHAAIAGAAGAKP